jgi:hypothetical protein
MLLKVRLNKVHLSGRCLPYMDTKDSHPLLFKRLNRPLAEQLLGAFDEASVGAYG